MPDPRWAPPGEARYRKPSAAQTAQGHIAMTRRNRKGFTLIEILIVVIILGILAAIVIPQFTNASKEAKQSSLVTMVQSLRSQIALFKLQHNDYLPGQLALVGSGGTFDSTVFWDQLTQF